MLREFAVEPEAIATWERFRYVIEKFGFEQGRLISRFPENWPRLVERAMESSERSWQARQKMAERLRRLKRGDRHALIALEWRANRYHQSRSWRTNAIDEHQRYPFHAVVTVSECKGLTPVIVADSAEDRDFVVDRSVVVPRTAEGIAAAVAPLLTIATEILFVDPYYRAEDERCRRPLIRMLELATANGRIPRRCEFHTSTPGQMRFRNFEDLCRRNLAPALPRGMKFRIFRWKQVEDQGRPTGERIHPRYILTDVGGISVEGGLDEGRPGETTDLSLMSEAQWRFRWEQYSNNPRLCGLGSSPSAGRVSESASPTFSPADLDDNGRVLFVELGAGPPP